jgi:anti-sigma factor RsiW
MTHATEHDKLREGDLLAFLDGAAPPGVAAHIAGCARCQAALAELRSAEALLLAAVQREDCPAPELLLRFVSGLLPAAEAAPVTAHTAVCAACAADLALLDAPPVPSFGQQLVHAGRRLVRLLLQPPSATAPALRGRAVPARRLVYAAEGYELVLVIAPAARSHYQIEGQLLGVETEGGAVRLSGSAQAERSANVDELGFFAFDAVPPGAYALDLALPDAQLLAELLEVP